MKSPIMSVSTESFYNRFAFFYPLVDIFLRPQKNVLFNEINALPGGNLLEIGVGNGAHLRLYKKHNVTGIDTSSAMLKIAQKRNHKSIQLYQMDGQALLFPDEQFDYIVLSHVIAVVDNPEQLVNEAGRVLRPGGRIFILNHFTPDNWLKHIDHFFGIIAKAFHFRSVIDISQITTMGRYMFVKEIRIGALSYFKLLIYQKR